MNDIDLVIENIINHFDKGFKESDKIKSALEVLKENKATFKNANDLAMEVGNILSDVFKDTLNSDMLYNKKMYQEMAEKLVNSSLKKAHEVISDYSTSVMGNLNKVSKVSGGVVTPTFNQNKANGIVTRLVRDEFEKVKWILDAPVKTFCQSVVDDTVKVNVKHHARLGLKPVVKRVSSGNCCDWCNKLAGVYDYPDVPKDVYRRHHRCDCVLEYFPGDGKKQNVWKKKKTFVKKLTNIENSAKIEKRKRIAISENNSNNRLKNIAYAKAKEFKLNPIPSDKVVDILRKDSKKWLEKLTDDEKRSINKYTFNGDVKNELKLYDKLNKFLSFKYSPVDLKEKEMLLRYFSNINNGLLKNNLDKDLIVYRKDLTPHKLSGKVNKFLSTSVTQKGVIGGKPNVAIIVPKGAKGAYIEELSDEVFKKQREFLFSTEIKLEKVGFVDDMCVYIVKGD